ncbi:hypothetical protein Syun_003742 [Stephania yunnanensis]|uniref:Uncharacterized protein n=1 Tax=Stephania yunnanensis TaxID=152371 RepID=A0AAP0L4B8_9MAGN
MTKATKLGYQGDKRGQIRESREVGAFIEVRKPIGMPRRTHSFILSISPNMCDCWWAHMVFHSNSVVYILVVAKSLARVYLF